MKNHWRTQCHAQLYIDIEKTKKNLIKSSLRRRNEFYLDLVGHLYYLL